MALSLSSVPGSDDRPRKTPVKKTGDSGKALKERLRNALITGTAGGYLGGMLLEGKARVKVPDLTRKLLRMKRKTVSIHGARTGALAGAVVGATNKGKRSETADAIGTGGDWKFDCGCGGMKKKPLVRGRVIVRRRSTGTERPGLQRLSQFSAYIEDMTFSSLPKEVQADITRFVDAAKGTPVVHYGMTVKELLDKADPVNLATARKNLGTLRASRAADEVIGKVKDGSKFVLLMNDRIVDGHHFLAKAERGKVTSSLNVLDLTPARIVTAKKVELSKPSAQCSVLSAQFETRFEEEKKKSSWKRKAAIAGGAVAGGVLGARTLPRLIRRGRPLKAGEELAGKVIYTNEGLTTPLSVIKAGGKTLRRRLEKHAVQKRSKLAGMALKVDDFMGIPQRHYGIGAGGGRVIEKTKAHGHRIVDKEGFARGNAIQVDSDTLPKDSSKWGKWAEGMQKRHDAAAGKAKKGDLCLVGNNCEHHARDIAGQGRKSYQSQAIVGGLAGGAAAGGAAVAAATRKKKEEKKFSRRGGRLIQFEEPRRNRVRDLRDRIGLAKDVAGLGVIVGSGVGAHKLYKAGRAKLNDPALGKLVKQGQVAVRNWARAGKNASRMTENVNTVTSGPATIIKGAQSAGKAVVRGMKKLGTFLHHDPRQPVLFTRRQPMPPPAPVPAERSKLEKVRDASLATAGVVGTGAVLYGGHKLRGWAKEVKQTMRRTKPASAVDNLRNATAISADAGKAWRWITDPARNWKRTAAKTRGNFRRASQEAAAKPAPKWAKSGVRVLKKLRLLEVLGAQRYEFDRTPIKSFYPTSKAVVDRAAKVPVQYMRLGKWGKDPAGSRLAAARRKKWAQNLRQGRAEARIVQAKPSPSPLRIGVAAAVPAVLAAGYLVHRARKRRQESKPKHEFGLAGTLLGGLGGLAGAAAGNKFRYPMQNALKKRLIPKLGKTWGRRVARAGAYLPETVGSAIGGGLGTVVGGGLRTRKIQPEEMGRVWNVGGRLIEFGGKEQLKDIDRGGFLDPLDVFVGRKRGYTSDQVKKYNRLKNYVDDVRSGRRKGSGATVASAESEMKSIRSSASTASHGQVFRSLMRKGDDVRRVTERGGGLAKDAIAHLRGDPRERDASGRQKKREWEKSWFQRTRNQALAGVALGGGYMALKGRPKLRAKMDRVMRQGKRAVNKVVPDFFPDVKPLRVKGQKTVASVQAKQQAKAQAQTAKVTNIVKQAAQQTAQAAASIPKKAPAAPKAATPAPAPKAPVKPVASNVVPMKKAASKPAAAPKAPVTTVSSSKSQVSSAPANPWAQSKLASTPPAPTAAEKAVAESKKKSKSKSKSPSTKPTGFMAFGPVVFAFEKPFAGYNAKRHARTGGLNDSFRKAYNREHGSNLKRPVTTPPSKLKAGSEAAGRRKSFCARMGGMQGPTSKGGKLTPKGAALKRWNCSDARRLFVFSDDPLDVGWDLRDARGRSARVFAPGSRPRERRPKQWHEKIDNERKLWAAAGLAGTGLGAAATKKLMGNVLKRQAQTAAATATKRAALWKRFSKGERGKLSSQARVRKAAKPKSNIVPMDHGPGMAA